jgi:hypothetical protein
MRLAQRNYYDAPEELKPTIMAVTMLENQVWTAAGNIIDDATPWPA